jgi:hypothetical protein
VSLEDACHKTLREEEAGDPETEGLAILKPMIHELNALQQVSEP